ncbi:cyclase family protein [Kitasatospora sp. NBC_01302]|uniref:cyclase family protein n=1 Tax=Kitasatospora sp. NBC_01302 TaxID=2903575 RepID=UPI002E0FDB3A|nr:cyclase family protein [Kitasatospora sp. NBC_01302]
MATRTGSPGPPPLSSAEFRALYQRVRREAVRGTADRGALDTLTPTQVLAAAGEVRSGRTVSLAAVLETRARPGNPEPCEHQMTGVVDGSIEANGLQFASDRFAMNVHGDADGHIDALCHVVYDGTLHNGVAASSLTATGATKLSIDVARDGIVGRGVLLDIPRLRGVPWLEPGDHVTGEELAAAESAQHLRVTRGDLLFVRVGHRRRQRELGPWNAAEARAGLHPTAMGFLADRQVAALGSDGNSDTAPSTTEGVAFPVHVLGIHAMGLHLLDYLQFEDLVPICEEQGRWSFLCVIAPLRLPGATGSPVNPIAVL